MMVQNPVTKLNKTPEEIDNILPQTQCGLCGHGGCMPYAEAMVYDNAPINLCPPGGVKTLKSLGQLLDVDVSPFMTEMELKQKSKTIAVIKEAECIGCTKCIAACPVDAIIGSAKQMHTVITDQCTGCELCVPPCPVDCIDLLPATAEQIEIPTPNQARDKFLRRNKRLQAQQKASAAIRFEKTNSQRKNYIQAALERAKQKKKTP